MPVVKFTGTVSRIVEHAPDLRSFHIALPKGLDFSFLPGQFLSVKMAGADGKPYGPRSYSIASSPTNKDQIELTIKKTGAFTSAIFSIKEGHSLHFTGPFGLFYLDKDKSRGRDLCLIAGGTGIAPLMSMLRWAQETGLENRIILLYSARTRNDVIYALELAERASQYENFRCIITLTREERASGWPGEYGRINADKLKRHVPNLPGTDFLACGPPEMVNAVVKALFDLGVQKQHVKIERWE
jgi:ferredoxin-NADP reductase